jgi:hypothetical protein
MSLLVVCEATKGLYCMVTTMLVSGRLEGAATQERGGCSWLCTEEWRSPHQEVFDGSEDEKEDEKVDVEVVL